MNTILSETFLQVWGAGVDGVASGLRRNPGSKIMIGHLEADIDSCRLVPCISAKRLSDRGICCQSTRKRKSLVAGKSKKCSCSPLSFRSLGESLSL